MIRLVLLAILWTLSCASISLAQTAQITGRVTDASEAVVPGAAITIANVETGIETKTDSNDEGYYTVPLLPPGTYSITARKQGFRTVNRSGVTLQVEQVARIDFTFEVGSISEEVLISAEAPLLESETSSRGQVINNKAIEELPLNGRNFLQLARLSAGVLEPPRGDRAAPGGSFIANGVRATLNNFMLDGVDNNSKIVDIQNSSNVVIQPSVDALEEFKVQTHNFSAEFGYAAGAVVNATIKSGTNNFHGSAFEFLRNDVFDARDFFSRPEAPQPPLRRNQFGGTLGGPIIKEKSFFFGSYEGTRESRGITYLLTVPDAAARRGDFSADRPIFDPNTVAPNPGGSGSVRTRFPGNVIPANRLDPVAVRLASLLPLPNLPGRTNNFSTSPARRDERDQLDFRLDHNFSVNDKLFGRYSFTKREINNPGPFDAPLIGSNFFQQSIQSQRAQGLSIGETHTFSSSVINEVRLGYNRIRDDLVPFVTENILGDFGFRGIPPEPGVTGLPEISISGFANLGEATFLPNFKISETFQILDNVLFIRGNHSFKAGINYRYVRSFFNVSGQARGQFNFSGVFTQDPQNRAATGSSFADFLLGVPGTATLSNAFLGDIRYQYYGAYIQDDWKVSPRLTLNLGLRYELFTPPVERNNRQGNFLVSERKVYFAENLVPAGIPSNLVTTVPDGVSERGLLEVDKNNLAPRAGFAYQLASRTVVRGGAGVFYADHPAIGAGNRLAASPPFRRQANFPTNQITPIIVLQQGFPLDALGTVTINPAATNFIYFSREFPQAYTYHWNLDVQREFHSLLLEVGYTGTKGTQLPVSFDLNQALPGPGSVASRRPIQGFGGIITEQPFGNSNYHALQLRVERRFTQGFGLLAAYTFSKSIDYGGEQLNGDDQRYRTSQDLRSERALSLYDIRHRFVASSLYDLPFGRGRRFDFDSSVLNALLGNWQINGIATLRSGTPFTPQLGFSTANTGDARPNRIRDGNLSGSERTVERWFDVSAFQPATSFNFGNAGKNILIGPGAVNFDMSLFKRIPVSALLGERGEVQFRAEAFNIFNTPQFANPNPRVDIPQGGRITSLVSPMRELQFGLKILF